MRVGPARLAPVVVLLASVASSRAQTWVTTTDDYLADQVNRVIQTRDGRFLAVANTGRALALIKRNSDGSLLWQRQLMGSPTGEAGYDGVELPDGRIVAVGDIFVNEHGNDDAAFVVFSPGAESVLRQRTFGGPGGDDRALRVIAAGDGGFLLVGETLSWGAPGRRMLAVRLDPDGDLLWARVFGSSGGDDVLYSGAELPGGGFLVGGGSGAILKLDPAGTLVWSRPYGLEQVGEMATTADGGVVVAGWRSVGGVDAAELIELDTAGEILWRASYGQTGVAYRFFAVAPTAGGGLLAGGEVNGPGPTDLHPWLARLDAAGGIVWQRHLDDVGGEIRSVATAGDGSLVVGGRRESFPRMMIARLDASGAAPGCSHPSTSAVRMASPSGWTAESRSIIEATGLVSRETAKPLEDASFPQDETVCQGGPTYPPSEVSPPAAPEHPLLFQDERTLVWEGPGPSFSSRFDLYRGGLAALRVGVGPSCLVAGLAQSAAVDPESPAPGEAFVYLVGGTNGAGRGALGRASDGSPLLPETPCP